MQIDLTPGEQAAEPKIRDVVFVHLPRTGGTSMRNMLAEAFPDSVQLFDYGPETFQLGGSFVDAHARNIRSQRRSSICGANWRAASPSW